MDGRQGRRRRFEARRPDLDARAPRRERRRRGAPRKGQHRRLEACRPDGQRAVGRAAKKQRAAALAASDANGLRTFLAWCSISEAGGQSFLDADEVLWIDGSDTDALTLFGIDPAGVTNGYALYDADEEVFSYSFSDSASFIVYLGGVREGANRSGFITVVKNSGRILARVTTDGESVSAVEQINVP